MIDRREGGRKKKEAGEKKEAIEARREQKKERRLEEEGESANWDKVKEIWYVKLPGICIQILMVIL